MSAFPITENDSIEKEVVLIRELHGAYPCVVTNRPQGLRAHALSRAGAHRRPRGRPGQADLRGQSRIAGRRGRQRSLRLRPRRHRRRRVARARVQRASSDRRGQFRGRVPRGPFHPRSRGLYQAQRAGHLHAARVSPIRVEGLLACAAFPATPRYPAQCPWQTWWLQKTTGSST